MHWSYRPAMATRQVVDVDVAARDALVERLFDATVGALELFSVYLGWRLGLYQAMSRAEPVTADQLATFAGIDRRYAREWLEQQAVAGFVTVVTGDGDTADSDGASPGRSLPVDGGGAGHRRYLLPDAHREVLADAESLAHVTPFAPMLVGIAGTLPEVADAYRNGVGVPFHHYGTDLRHGQGAINRPSFRHELSGWFAAMPELDRRLRAVPPARVADLGCGQGYSTIAIKRAYPDADVTGFDLDSASIAEATRLATDTGVTVAFRLADAGSIPDTGRYDLICLFESLHDMPRPVAALVAARQALAPGGTVLVADERVADTFTAPGDAVERMMYGWSVTHCLPASRVEPGSAALGTVLRAGTVRRLGYEAGFAQVSELPIEHDFFRFYRLR